MSTGQKPLDGDLGIDALAGLAVGDAVPVAAGDVIAEMLRLVRPTLREHGEEDAVDAVVWDVAGRLSEARIDAFAGPGGPDVTPPTVIRVDADWGVGLPHDTAAGAPPDLVLDGRIDGWISVEPRGGEPYRVSVVAGPGEERYVGGLAEVTPAGAAPSASPDRR